MVKIRNAVKHLIPELFDLNLTSGVQSSDLWSQYLDLSHKQLSGANIKYGAGFSTDDLKLTTQNVRQMID